METLLSGQDSHDEKLLARSVWKF